MKYYISIKVLSTKLNKTNVLFNETFSKIHHALWDMKSNNIGISFPNHDMLLGDVIRIHGTEKDLNLFLKQKSLNNLPPRTTISKIKEIPTDVTYQVISRKQPNMSMAKLRRLIKRGNISNDDIKKYKIKMLSKSSDAAFIDLRSGSNGNRHRRYIEFGDILENPINGNFDKFGMSKAATIPVF